MPGPILRQLDLPNGLTLGGLFLAFFAVVLSLHQRFEAAVLCILWAGVIDLFDGFLAHRSRRTPLQAAAGKELDSLVDLCAFGLAPVLFAYAYGLRDALSVGVLLLYLTINALRLAYFNHAGLTAARGSDYYTGLPVTYAALFVPLGFTCSLFASPATTRMVLAGLFLALTAAMASSLPIRKLRGIWYGVFSLGALALTAVYLRVTVATW